MRLKNRIKSSSVMSFHSIKKTPIQVVFRSQNALCLVAYVTGYERDVFSVDVFVIIYALFVYFWDYSDSNTILHLLLNRSFLFLSSHSMLKGWTRHSREGTLCRMGPWLSWCQLTGRKEMISMKTHRPAGTGPDFDGLQRRVKVLSRRI